MFIPPSPLMTYNQQRPQYQAVANNQPAPMVMNPMAKPQDSGMNPLTTMMAMQGMQKMGNNAEQVSNTNAQLQANGANPLTMGQRAGAMLGFNDYAQPGGVADAMRMQQGMNPQMQGAPMPMDMFKANGGTLNTNTSFFPSWMTSLFS